jgi:RNA polymerase sigma factor (sigma-70 family)
MSMDEKSWLAGRFEENRAHLRAVALRMLGSSSEAEDAVQEAWLKVSRAETGDVQNLGGWLTTVVARVCLDMLRSRKSRREEELGGHALARAAVGSDDPGDPERDTLLADSVGAALLVVLDTLAPVERVAFVLHDLFGRPFEEIAPIVGRSPAATRQLASRGRRRVQGAAADAEADRARQREVVGAFLAASRSGDFAALLAVLDPDVVLRADELAVRAAAAAQKGGGAPSLEKEIHGAHAVAEAFKGRARGALPALIDGDAGMVWAPGAVTRAVFAFTVEAGKIVEIDLFMDPARLERLKIEPRAE